MKQSLLKTRQQLTLCLEREARHQPEKELKLALVDALADLLLQAALEEMPQPKHAQGASDESEDHL